MLIEDSAQTVAGSKVNSLAGFFETLCFVNVSKLCGIEMIFKDVVIKAEFWIWY